MVFVVSSFQVFEKNSIVESKQRIIEFLSKSFSIEIWGEIREINVAQKKKKKNKEFLPRRIIANGNKSGVIKGRSDKDRALKILRA